MYPPLCQNKPLYPLRGTEPAYYVVSIILIRESDYSLHLEQMHRIATNSRVFQIFCLEWLI